METLITSQPRIKAAHLFRQLFDYQLFPTPPEDREHLKKVHPEFHGLERTTFEGIITVRFDGCALSRETDEAENRRKDFVDRLVSNLCQKFRIKERRLFWVYSSEFGIEGKGHSHVTFSFDLLRRQGRPIPDLGNFSHDLQESTDWTSGKLGLVEGAVKSHWKPKWLRGGDGHFDLSDEYIARYLCKFDGNRDFKRIISSWSPAKHRDFFGLEVTQ